MTAYEQFLASKTHSGRPTGFPVKSLPDWLFDFQQSLVEWSLWRGRAAMFADCGMGKTPMQLVWSDAILRHANKNVLILTPLAVGPQTVKEGQKFGITAIRSRDGALPSSPGIVVTNYEQLHKFSPSDFVGVVCDESSILKHFSGATQKQVTRFLAKVPYRLLCTATAAPNDYIELGTSSEALGELGYSDMLTRFFIQSENLPHRMQEVKDWRTSQQGNHFAKLAYRVSQQINQWRLKGHAEMHFWRWVCSWARACRKPSDLGAFDDARFVLPELNERDHIFEPKRPADGMLFTVPAFGLKEERDERRRTLTERCEYVAELVKHDEPAVVWCHLNAEGDLLHKLMPNAVQVKGANTDDEKEEAYRSFQSGETRVLIIKPKIGAFGLNWQHCAHVVTFATHSYEQYYQAVRRCWRFGQTRPVTVDVVATVGEQNVRDNMRHKAEQASKMFDHLVSHMHDAMTVKAAHYEVAKVEVPTWLTV